MTTRRKPAPKPKPLPVAIDELVWRARIVTEFLEGYELSEQTVTAVNKLVDAIATYEVSRDYRMPVKEEKP